jgi:hypothetical protein
MNFSRLFHRNHHTVRLARCRPAVEALEERLVMNNRFVVPVAQADNVSKFGTLNAALTTAGLQAGDIIQIEPGTAPGSIAALPALKNLTIQGDQAYQAANLPQFTLTADTAVDATRAGLVLRNANFKLDGQLDYQTDAAIFDCNIVGDTQGIVLDQTTGSVVARSMFVLANPNLDFTLLLVKPTDNSHALIEGNTFVSIVAAKGDFLDYSSGNKLRAITTDRIVNNTLVANNPGYSGGILDINGDAVDGLTIEDNLLRSSDKSGTAAYIAFGNQHVVFRRNDVTFTGGNGFAVEVGDNSLANRTSSVDILNNRILADQTSYDLALFTGPTDNSLTVRVEGNDFAAGQAAVDVYGDSNAATKATVDLGGGTLGSKGGNNFRAFNDPGHMAISINTSKLAGSVPAQGNLFSVNPVSVINNASGGKVTVVSSNSLTGTAAYVQTLYLDLLKRTGDLSSQADAGGWVTLLNNGASTAAVANAIGRSPEALGARVDELYHRYLGRDADAGGRGYFVSILQLGATLEGAATAMLASAEYQARHANDTDYVSSLYYTILGRNGSAGELAGWVSQLPQLGRDGVAAAILGSAEYRGDFVTSDYYTLLHRKAAPGANEVAGWVNSGLDAYTIALAFAAGPEFQVDG